MKRIILSILSALFVSVVRANEKVENNEQLDIQERVIENGLRVIVVNLKSNGSVAFGVGYFVGAGDDPRNLVGVSHFLEHMMLTGTKNISESKLSKIKHKYSKESNAATYPDITFYHCKCAKPFLDINMKIEADRMQNLDLEEARIEKEKNVIIEERKMVFEAPPLKKFVYNEFALKALFLYSNYSYPGIGYLDQIENCDKQALKKHYEKFYYPNNAFVLLAGDITIDEAEQKVRKYFGTIKAGPTVKRERVIDPKELNLRHVIDNASDQISIRKLEMMFKIDRDFLSSLRNELILGIIIDILNDASMLHKILVDQKELCYGSDVSWEVRAFDKGIICISAEIRDRIGEKLVEEEIEEIVYNFADKYLTKELFETEKTKILDSFDLAQDSPDLMSNWVLYHVCNGRPIKDIKNIKNIMNSITFDEVKKTASLLLTKENKILQIYSHPKEKKQGHMPIVKKEG